MSKKAVFFLFFALLTPWVDAVSLYGTVYDNSLNKVNDAIIHINSTPAQRFVAKDGTFLFSLPIGDYHIKAEFEELGNIYIAEEDISVTEVTGDYVLDLKLPAKLVQEKSKDPTFINLNNDKPSIFFYLLVAVWVIIVGAVIFIFKDKVGLGVVKDEKEESKDNLTDELKEVLRIVKKSGKRVTQKDIRKEIPLSEGKISLMVSELEEKGFVKKIKKGRGNIIILNK